MGGGTARRRGGLGMTMSRQAKENGRGAVSARQLDSYDNKILQILQSSARLSNKDIAKQVNLSATPCLRRIRLLEQMGVIERYKAVLEPRRLGYTIHAFLSVKRERESSREGVAQRLLEIPQIVSMHIVSGEFDLMAELVARDMDEYARIAIDGIAEIPGIYDLRTTFSIRVLKREGNIPVALE